MYIFLLPEAFQICHTGFDNESAEEPAFRKKTTDEFVGYLYILSVSLEFWKAEGAFRILFYFNRRINEIKA